jgi:transposase
VDFRKQSSGLASVVASEFNKPVAGGALFVFMGRAKDQIRLLYWDKTGFALWTKRLEKDKFSWSRKLREENATVDMSAEKLEWLLSGMDIFRVKKHTSVDYKYFF